MNLISNQFFLKIYSKFFAQEIGQDEYGNKYYAEQNNSPINNYRERRWVIYDGEIEASKVPQRWNAWLHHVTKEKPTNYVRKEKWMKKHLPNSRRIINLDIEKKYSKKNYQSWNPNND